ncbi:hypothetical protein CR513_41218, partial [Mucuna pruriens]
MDYPLGILELDVHEGDELFVWRPWRERAEIDSIHPSVYYIFLPPSANMAGSWDPTTFSLEWIDLGSHKYPSWLSNVVMVKKPSGKWRMCTDYTDLYRLCPKDSYPLPSIDALVDEASGCELLSFMDTYLGYNQIRMHLSDELKKMFIMDGGNFCYRVMPFGLKNTRATC